MVAHAARIDTSPEKVVRLHGSAFVADPSGALFWPDEHLMVVADLHLEKGSSYAQKRVFLPPYDTSATLAKLAAAVARLAPRRIVALGDSFHDRVLVSCNICTSCCNAASFRNAKPFA